MERTRFRRIGETNLAGIATGNQFQASRSADRAGGLLQLQANNLGIGRGTNWVDVTSSDQTNLVIVQVNGANSVVFLRWLQPYQPFKNS